MKWMRQVPFVFFNAFLLPMPAFANDLLMNEFSTSTLVASENAMPEVFSEPLSIAAPEGFENAIPQIARSPIFDLKSQVPDGFEMFPAQNDGLFGSLIELNKLIILQLQEVLE